MFFPPDAEGCAPPPPALRGAASGKVIVLFQAGSGNCQRDKQYANSAFYGASLALKAYFNPWFYGLVNYYFDYSYQMPVTSCGSYDPTTFWSFDTSIANAGYFTVLAATAAGGNGTIFADPPVRNLIWTNWKTYGSSTSFFFCFSSDLESRTDLRGEYETCTIRSFERL